MCLLAIVRTSQQGLDVARAYLRVSDRDRVPDIDRNPSPPGQTGTAQHAFGSAEPDRDDRYAGPVSQPERAPMEPSIDRAATAGGEHHDGSAGMKYRLLGGQVGVAASGAADREAGHQRAAHPSFDRTLEPVVGRRGDDRAVIGVEGSEDARCVGV